MDIKRQFLLYSLLLLVYISNAQNGGYTLIFGGNFKNEKVSIECLPMNFFKKIEVSSDESISISKDFLFFDSSFFGKKIQLVFKGIEKKTVLTLKETSSIKYVYIWYIRKKISYEILDNRLDMH